MKNISNTCVKVILIWQTSLSRAHSLIYWVGCVAVSVRSIESMRCKIKVKNKNSIVRLIGRPAVVLFAVCVSHRKVIIIDCSALRSL